MINGLESFVGIFCIGRGIWFPTYQALDTVEKIADVRSAVGVQWLLFSQTMNSARAGIDLLRELQQLVGEVERITEMLEILDSISAAKKSEKKATFLHDNCIKFEDVTIKTPAVRDSQRR